MKPCHATKTGTKSPAKRRKPPSEWSSTSWCESSVIATTNTRSKKSSSQLACRSPLSPTVRSRGGTSHGWRPVGAQGDAEARRQRAHPLVGIGLQGCAEPRRDRARVGPGRLDEDQRELVAADPEGGIGLAENGRELFRHALENGVAGSMAVAVVDLLEPVQVEHDQREWAPVAARPSDFGVEVADERAPVQEVRERVVIRQEPELRELVRGRERRRRLVREDPQRLQALLARQEPVARLVGPDDADHAAVRVAERDDEPVVVPRVRA